MKNLTYIISAFFLIACSENKTNEHDKKTLETLTTGQWLLTFNLDKGIETPTNFNLEKTDSFYHIIFSNATEKIRVTDINVTDNKIIIKDPVFNNWFEGNIVSPTQIEGVWFKNDTNYKVPFVAKFGEHQRFSTPSGLNEAPLSVAGKEEVPYVRMEHRLRI